MSFKHTVIALAAGSGLLLFGVPAFSLTGQIDTTTFVSTSSVPAPATKLAAQYSTLAGSTSNADALVAGLRDDTEVKLVGSPSVPSASFSPATGKLGYGNINIALSLAKADLAKQGITSPTPSQLAAALNGGLVTTATGTVTMAGVLAQRQTGLGWGQIANAMGVKLGSLVSASKTDKAGPKAERVAKADAAAKSGQAHANSGKGSAGGNSGGGGGNGGGNGGGGGHK
ncbi:MAG: hypothetical protein ABI606_04740 [Rhodoferax sp.]